MESARGFHPDPARPDEVGWNKNTTDWKHILEDGLPGLPESRAFQSLAPAMTLCL